MDMKILRDNFPHKTSSSPVRKIGLLSIPVAVSMAMMYCGQQVNKILDERRDTTEEMSPDTSVAEKADITEGWNEAQENQVLMIYRIKKGDTLSSIARKHGVTLESILNINKKITSPDTIQIGQAILIPYDGDEEDQETVSPAIHPSNTASIAFSQASLVKIMRNVLTRPEGDML